MDIELTNKTQPQKKNFNFVDTIRCISMIGIVMEHCSMVPSNHYNRLFDRITETSIIQSFKFSTIAFFLIGGFLINHKFQEYTPGQYLKNRFKKTIGPWLFWILIFIALTTLDRYIAYTKGGDVGQLVTEPFKFICMLFFRIVMFSPYWFILNFLICISILLVFKKYLYNIWFGAILSLFSLFYSINIYAGWIETTHTTAILGFVFYLWLGVYFNKYYDKVIWLINAVSWSKIVIITIISFAIAVAESTYLNHIGIEDAYNTLRLSNIVYSLIMFVLLLKIGNINWLQQNLKPRETTFGIYLLHIIIIDRGLPLIFQPLKLNVLEFTIWQDIGTLLLRFLITYGTCFLLTRLIGRTKMKWAVGN